LGKTGGASPHLRSAGFTISAAAFVFAALESAATAAKLMRHRAPARKFLVIWTTPFRAL